MGGTYDMMVNWCPTEKSAKELFDQLAGRLDVSKAHCDDAAQYGTADGYGASNVLPTLKQWSQELADYLGCEVEVYLLYYDGQCEESWEVQPRSG
jgi:hypothetical protein